MKTYDSVIPRADAYLALADGTIFMGRSAGAAADTCGEAVFCTAMTGYQETLSDPSYAGQFVCFTAPEIGNAGVNRQDMESEFFRAAGLLAHRVNPPSNWRAEEPLPDALRRAGMPALEGVDTRALTLHLRDHGAQKAFLCATGSVAKADGVLRAAAWEGIEGKDYVAEVTCASRREWMADSDYPPGRVAHGNKYPAPDLRVVVYDYGVKRNILRMLAWHGMAATLVPAATSADDVLSLRPDGVFLSNGPGDPAMAEYATREVAALLGKAPIMGICLGHQLLARALGGRTYRLPFGHHGCNHPVKDMRSGKVMVTSQNHNFAVDADSLNPRLAEATHVSLNDGSLEGLSCREAMAFSVQFHPEAAPGPRDAEEVFGQFRESILTGRAR